MIRWVCKIVHDEEPSALKHSFCISSQTFQGGILSQIGRGDAVEVCMEENLLGSSQDELHIFHVLSPGFLFGKAYIFFEKIDTDNPRTGKRSSDFKSENPRPAGLIQDSDRSLRYLSKDLSLPASIEA